jgi:hypothetical protein
MVAGVVAIVACVTDIGSFEVNDKLSTNDGFMAIATSSIVVVRTDINVIEVITQLHIWQSP